MGGALKGKCHCCLWNVSNDALTLAATASVTASATASAPGQEAALPANPCGSPAGVQMSGSGGEPLTVGRRAETVVGLEAAGAGEGHPEVSWGSVVSECVDGGFSLLRGGPGCQQAQAFL